MSSYSDQKIIRIGIFPIGICGMGKSTFIRNVCIELQKNSKNHVLLIERDKIFGKFRDEGNSVRHAKKKLLEYYQNLVRTIQELDKNDINFLWILFDTSNLTKDTREKSIELFEIEEAYSIYFSFPKYVQNENQERMKQFLQDRIILRQDHPTFPQSYEEKIKTFNKLWDSFERSEEYEKHFYEKDRNWNNEKILYCYEKKNISIHSHVYHETVFQWKIF
jgi:hypothetical protein